MLIWLCFWNFRSLRDLILMMFIIVSISMIMTLHISNNLPWRHQQENQLISRRVYNAVHSMGQQEKFYHGFWKISQRWPSAPRAVSQLLWRLLETEDKMLTILNTQKVILSGTVENLDEKMESLHGIFSKHGLSVESVSNNDIQLQSPLLGNWSMLYCLEHAGGSYCKQVTDKKLRKHQKVNRIPELHEYFSKPGAICDLYQSLMLHGETEVEWNCYRLPSQHSELKKSICKGDNPSFWSVFTDQDGSLKIFPANLSADDIDDRNLKGAVVWTRNEESGGLNSVWYLQLYTLVTSFLPQSSYLYPKALLQSFEHTHFKNSSLKFVDIKNFLYELGEKFHNVTADYMLEMMKEVIFTSLIGMEFDTVSQAKKVFKGNREYFSRCTGCFQLLEYYITFDSQFHPFILQIRPYSYGDGMFQDLMADTADMLLAQTKVAMDVARGLDGMVPDFVHMKCDSDSSLCLSEDDYTYLLNNRRESLASKSFIKVYPTKAASNYSCLINQIQHLLTRGQVRTLESIGEGDISLEKSSSMRWKSTANLHSLLLGLEKFYANLSLKTESYMQAEKLRRRPQENAMTVKDNCSKDEMDIPLLLEIFTEPSVHFSPDFNPHITEYHAAIDYDTFLIKIWAEAKGCNCEARLDEKYGTSRPLNYTLGIGYNEIAIIVVDLSHNSPWVVNSYSLHVYRREAEYGLLQLSPKLCQVCSLKQDCSMIYSPSELCGLQSVKSYHLWSSYVEALKLLPLCESGDVTAKWLVPCFSCNQSHSCYWKHAVWQPDNCRYDAIPENEAKKCLMNKKVLFIGDSTNRGILHYITGKINGSLQEWDKTHDIKLYDNINGNGTVLSFAYYPQFWLPANHRPTFIKALYQLIRRTLPLTNDSNTALVVGGVHWLAKDHIKVILSALEREGLTGITLIVKGLGAGFHQQVEGVRYVPQEDQYKLLLHEQDVSVFARRHGFRVVQTYNMTVARYKNFLQGKCACHFHKVVRVPNLDMKLGIENPVSSVYHVEGRINGIYSEMVINQICRFPNR